MENSEKKSLISTGSSNLAKTEKLLSITKKILSEIKPQYESVRIGNQEWMTRNLDVDRFMNGDLIPHIELDVDWEKAGQNEQPAWCYYDNDPENGKKYGKLYNWYAVNDPRGLAPMGYHIPTFVECNILNKFLGKVIAGYNMKSVDSWKEWRDHFGKILNGNGDNSSGFNALPGGYRGFDGSFNSIGYGANFWNTSKFVDKKISWYNIQYYGNGNEYRSDHNKPNGFSVRCLRDRLFDLFVRI